MHFYIYGSVKKGVSSIDIIFLKRANVMLTLILMLMCHVLLSECIFIGKDCTRKHHYFMYYCTLLLIYSHGNERIIPRIMFLFTLQQKDI